MPSQLHEALLLLFRNRPTLAPELMRDALHCELPAFTEARIDSADLTDVKPAEYRADLVVLLLDGVPVYGIVVEAQLARKPRKKFVWPVYATSLRARLEVPVCVLVVAADEAIARWAAQPIDLGNGGVFRPLVLSPSGVPEVIDEAQARADPELAVLSAMAHGREAAESARAAAKQAFGSGDDWSAVPQIAIPASAIKLVDLVVDDRIKAFPSKRQAKERIAGGGVRIDGEVVRDPERELRASDFADATLRLQAGKKTRLRVILGG